MSESPGNTVVLVVDVANVMGSRPDGWWRDRLAAATRLLGQLAPITALTLDGEVVTFERVLAVVEGRAREASGPAPIEVIRAEADGDSTIVDVAAQVVAQDRIPLVVTADRGLRARLPEQARYVGPRVLLAAL